MMQTSAAVATATPNTLTPEIDVDGVVRLLAEQIAEGDVRCKGHGVEGR
jgi:hypothetical protein